MIPYLIIYTYILTAYFLNNIDNQWVNKVKTNKVVEIFLRPKSIFILLFLFAALRGNGNGDYFKYIENVEKVNSFSFVFYPVNFPFEFGYRLFAYLINILHFPAQTIIIVMNAISIFAVYKFCEKYSKDLVLSAILFFPIMLMFDMHHSRSAVAMSLGLWFFSFLNDKKYLEATLSLLIAALFHKSAFLLIVIVPIISLDYLTQLQERFIHQKEKKLVFVFLLSLFLIIFNPMSIVTLILNNPITAALHYKFVSYLGNERWSYPFSLFDPRLVQLVYIYIMITYIYNYKDGFINKLIRLLLLSIFTIISLRSSTILVMRVYNFFNMFIIVLLPNVIYLTQNEKDNDEKLTVKIFNKLYVLNKKLMTKYSLRILAVIYVVYTLALIIKQYDYFMFF